MQDSIFSRQFCGQHSYGLDDLSEHISQLPPSLASDTNHTSVNKPQAHFSDKIDNECPRAKKLLEQPFQLCDSEVDPFDYRAQGPMPTEAELVDDPVKYGEMLKHLTACNYAVVACLRHTFRSYYGLTCWIMIRCGAKGAAKTSESGQERAYLVDAIALRRYLKGSDNQELASLRQALLSNSQIVKIFVGENTLLQSAYEFALETGLTNYVTVSYSGEHQDDLVDNRIRSVDPQYMADLCS